MMHELHFILVFGLSKSLKYHHQLCPNQCGTQLMIAQLTWACLWGQSIIPNQCGMEEKYEKEASLLEEEVYLQGGEG